MQIVPDRTRTSLLPIIQSRQIHCQGQLFTLMTMPLTGVLIHTYTWSTYAIHFTPNYRTAVGQLPNVAQHRIVNHSLHFVDPVTNAHTQHVESYWNHVKIKFKRMRGVDNYQATWTNSCGLNDMGRQEQTVLTTLLETLVPSLDYS